MTAYTGWTKGSPSREALGDPPCPVRGKRQYWPGKGAASLSCPPPPPQGREILRYHATSGKLMSVITEDENQIYALATCLDEPVR